MSEWNLLKTKAFEHVSTACRQGIVPKLPHPASKFGITCTYNINTSSQRVPKESGKAAELVS